MEANQIWKEKPEWVPATERQPEENGQYLVLYDEAGIYIYEILSWNNKEDIWPRGWSKLEDLAIWPKGSIDYWENMVAWMKLPKIEEN